MTPRQAAEYRDELARCQQVIRERELTERRTALRARPKRPYGRRRTPPRVLPPTASERQLADRLLPSICLESVIDRDQHALGVARMLLNIGVRRIAA